MTPKKQQAPSETYAARARRGKPSVTVSMGAATKRLLQRLAKERCETMGETVAAALLGLANRWDKRDEK